MKTIAQKKCRVCVISALCVMLGAALLGSLGSFSVAATAQETPNDALPPAIDGDTARRELLVAALRGGQVTVEAARQGGDLSVDDVLEILATRLNDWGGFEWGKDEAGLRRALAKVLAEHGGERLKKEDLGKLPPKARLWLADYYQSIKDPRTVGIVESILSEFKVPSKGANPGVSGEDPLLYLTIERLAWHYRDAGQHEKAAQAWLLVEKMHEKTGWWTAYALTEVAWFYSKSGNKEKAGELYARAEQSGDDLHAGGALWGHAQMLIRAGRQAQAQALLEQTLKQAGPNVGVQSKHVIASSLLGYLHYLKAEWPQARKYYEQALAQSKRLQTPELRQSVADTATKSEDMLRLIGHWEKQQMVCDPPRIDISAGRDKKDEPIMRRFLVSVFRDVPLLVSSSDPKVKARIEESPWAEDEQPLQFERQVVLEIAPQSLREAFEATVTISSPQLPGFQARIPVRVVLQKH